MNENQNNYVDINAHDNYPDSEQKIEIPTMKVIPLKKICMTIGELPTSYLETMTYYEMLIWFIEYLKNNIIPTINNNASAIQEVQSVVLALQNYINEYKDSIDSDVEELEEYMNNYFENLDVQEEINNKLDDMLEDGVLEQIIEQFLQLTSLICFDNVADMKTSVNLANGSYAKTLGYYSKNSGGGAIYKIRTITNDDTVNESTIIALNDNTLIAELINVPNEIDIACLGAKYNDSTFNSSNILQFAVNNFNNIIINGDIYLGSKITINRNYIHVIQNSGKIYPTFTNDDLFRVTGYSVKMHVVISGDSQNKDNNISTTYSAVFVGDGGTDGAEKGRNFDFSYSEIKGYYGNGIKHVNGAFGDYSYATVHYCNGHGFYFPGGCKDNQLHNLSYAHAVHNKGTGYLLTNDSTDNSYTHDNDGILYPSTFNFNVTKAYGNAQNFYVNCGKHFGSVYSESSTTTHDYWACYRSTITYWAAAEEVANFTDAGTDNTFRYVDPWSQPITTNEIFNKVTISTNKIGKQELSQTANNSFNDIVIGDNVNPITVIHGKENATSRTDNFDIIKLKEATFEVKHNKIITGINRTVNAGATTHYYGDDVGQIYLNLSTTIPKLFVTAYSPSGTAIGVTATLYNRGTSGWTPIMLHITNYGDSAVNLSDCQFYIVAMN